MNNQQARFILSAYRPGGDDAGDPHFAEALAQARRDPALARWFDEARRFDDVVASKFIEAIPVPPELRGNILAGAKVSGPARWFRRPALVALAAMFMVLAAAALIWLTGKPRLAAWQTEALAMIPRIESGEMQLDHQSRKAGELQAWLRSVNAPAPDTLPEPLRALESIGCKAFAVDGRRVSIICFREGAARIVHLVVTTREGLAPARPENQPRFAKTGEWMTATWNQGDRAYMVATRGERANLERFLPGQSS